jgi:hypothetical protein
MWCVAVGWFSGGCGSEMPELSGDQPAGPCSPLVHREHRLIINTLSLSLYIYIYIYKCYLSP